MSSQAPPIPTHDQYRAMAGAEDFVGAKLALFLGADLLTYRRDRKPGIPHPGCRDLPGGGREGAETPFECAARELFEETALRLEPAQVVWARRYPGVASPATVAWFMVARMPPSAAAAIRSGDEGEDWRLGSLQLFLGDAGAVPYLKDRLRDYIDAERTSLAGWNAV